MPPVVAMRRFASGEVTPEMYAGTDTQAYLTGLRRLRNAYVMRMGGVQSRAGTLYKGATKNNGAVRLFSVVFDLNENYVLEFGNLYLRVWRDGSLVSVGTPAAWLTATAYTAGTVRANGGTNYVCILDHTSGASTEPGVGASWTTNWYALTDDIFEYPTPYTTAQLSALQIAYLYHVVTIVHPSHPPANLTWLADASWVLADIDFTTPAEAPTNLTASVSGTGGFTYAVTAVYEDGTESGISNTDETNNSAFAFTACTLTWTAASGAVSYNVYRSVTPLYTPLLLIGSSTTTTFVDNAPFAAGPGTPPEPTALFASTDNYPAVIGAYQQRLLLAATNNNPDAAYGSVSALPYDFTERNPLVDSDSLSWRQVGQRLNRIRFFSEIGARLIQFTDTGETFVQGSEDNILRPGEINPRQISWNGISPTVPPLLVDDTALYVQARGTQVRDLVPVNQEGYTGTELSRTALHFFDGYEIVDAAYQKVPHSVCWFVRDDGKVVSLTYVRESGIFGWALHDFGGIVERVASVWEGDEDAVYFVVNRTIDGNTVRYVERMDNRIAASPVLMDAARTFSATPSATAPYSVAAGYGVWSARTTPALTYGAVATDGVTLVAVSYDGDTSPVITSTDALTWTQRAAGTVNHLWNDVIWVADWGLFVAVSDTSGETTNVMTSPDGETWTTRTAPDTGWYAVAYSPTLDKAVAIGGSTTNVLQSSDGSTWANGAATGLPGAKRDIAWGGSRFVCVTDSALVYSANGTTWTTATMPTLVTPVLSPRVTYAGDRFVVAGYDNTGSGPYGLLTSTDGVTWTFTAFTGAMATFAANEQFPCAAWDATNERFYLMKSTGDFAYTDDFVTWTTATSQAGDWYDLLWVPFLSRLVASGINGSTDDIQTAVYSENGAIVNCGWLEGESVSVVNASGGVLASAYNPSEPQATITNGVVTFSEPVTATSGTIGLPYVVDVQTLDIDATSTTIKDREQFSGGLIAWVRNTGAFWAGPAEPTSDTSIAELERIIPQDENWNAVTTQADGVVEGVTLATRTRTGRVWVRQVDPVPMTILGIAPMGTTGGR